MKFLNAPQTPLRRLVAGVASILVVATTTGALSSPPAAAEPTIEQRVEILSMRTADAKHFLNPDGTYTGVFGNPLHYLDDLGLWQDVDLTLRPVLDGYLADHNDVIVKVMDTGVSAIDRKTNAGILWRTPERPAVDGRRATFSDQGLHWTYETRGSGIKLSAPVAAPQGLRTYTFSYELIGGSPLAVDGGGNLSGSGFSVPRAFAVGADHRRLYPAGPWRLLDGNQVAFDFDDSVVPADAFPYELDPTSTFANAGGGDDGELEGISSSYPPGGTPNVNTAASWLMTERSYWGNYSISNALMRWDTSSIPDDSHWSGTGFPSIKIYATWVANTNTRMLTADWYSAWPIGTSDYSQSAQTNAHLGTSLSSFAQNDYNWIDIDNYNGASRTGYTGLRLHVTGGTPTGNNLLEFKSGDFGSDSPVLALDYIPNAGPNLTAATDSPDPVSVGSTLTFSVSWWEPDAGDVARTVVCKTNSVSSSATCPGGTWASGGSFSATSPTFASYTPVAADVGTQNYYAFACDDSNACSLSASGTFTVNPAITSASDSPDPAYVGNSTTFSAHFSSGQAVKAAICKTNAVNTNATCPGGTWATGASFSSSSPATATYSPSTLDVGTQTYYAFVCTSGGLCSSSVSRSFTVQDPPDVTSASDTPDPVNPGNPVTFSVGWNNSIETAKAVICKTNAVTHGAGTCPGGTWTTGSVSATSPSTATYTTSTADSGSNTYFAFACTAANACSSNSASGTFFVNDAPTDSVAVMTPPAQVATAGSPATVTVNVTKVTGGPLRGVPVSFARYGANPGNGPADGPGTTDASGNASYTYTGANVGSDVVVAQVAGVTEAVAAATVSWRPNAVATEVVFNPPVEMATKNTTVTVDFTALKGDGTPFVGTVYYGVAAAGPPPAKTLTKILVPADNGAGSITFTPNSAGVWEVFAYADRPAPDGVVGAQDPTELDGAAAVVVQETCGTATTLTLTPLADAKPIGSSETVTATVLDNCGNAKSGATVNFTRVGANPGSGSGVTNGSGQATHTWTGASAGTDRVDATVSGSSTTSNPVEVVWYDSTPPSSAPWAVALSSSAPAAQSSASVILTATADQSVSGSGYAIQIFEKGTTNRVASCSTGSTCSASVSASAAPASTTTKTYVAYVAQAGSSDPPPGIQATSNPLAVTWYDSTPPSSPWAVTLVASPPVALTGSFVTLTAVTNQSVSGTGYVVEIFDQGTGLLVASCSVGTTCSASVLSPIAATRNYIAYVATSSSTAPPPNIQATSNQASVTWIA